MKKRCLLLLSLFLATLTGAWAQTISAYSITGTGCLGPGSTNPRSIGVSFSSNAAGMGGTAYRVAIFNSANVFQNSTTIPGLLNGANGPINVNVNGTGTGFYAQVQSSTDGITWTALTANSSGFDIQITPSINGFFIGSGSWFACEGSTITEVLTFDSPLNFGPYTVTYTINGSPNRGPFTAPGTLSAGNTNLSFVSQPLIDTDNGNFTIVSITGTGEPCAIGGLGSFNFVNVSQYPTISAATSAGPVCEATGSVFNLNGLIPLNTGGPPSPFPVATAVQRIKYKIDGGTELSAIVTVTAPTGTATIPTTGLADGNHTLTITAIEKVNADNTVCTRILMSPINVSFQVRSRPTLTIGALTSGPLCELETSNTWAATLGLSAFGTASPATSPYTILVAPPAVGISAIAGPTTAGPGTLTVTHTGTPGTKSATFTITDGNGCVSAPIAHSFVINANPTATITANPTFCAPMQGNQTAAVVVTASTGAQPYTTNWSASVATLNPAAGTAGAIATTGGTESRDASTIGGVNVVLTDNNGCMVTVTSTVHMLTVTNNTLTTMPLAGCSIFDPNNIDGSTPVAVLSAGPGPSSVGFAWARTGANNAIFVGEGPATEDYDPAALPANNTSGNHVYQYQRTVSYISNNGLTTCSMTSAPLSVTVWPNPIISDKGPGVPFVVCSGSAVAPYAPADGVAGDVVPTGTLYTWTVAANANVTGQANQAVGQTQFSTGNLTNLTTSVQTLVYTVTATTPNGCTDTFTITVTINPQPVITNAMGSPAPNPICASQTSTLTFVLAGVATNHTVSYSQTAGLPATTVLASPLTVMPGNFGFTSTPPSGDPVNPTTMTYRIDAVSYTANGVTCSYTLNAPSQSYTLNPEPPIPFGAGGPGSAIVIKDPITNKSEVCEGTGIVAITNDATCGGGFTTKWYVNNTTAFAPGSGLASAPATINTATGAAMHSSQPAVLSPGTITWYVACRNEVTGCETPPAKRKAVSFTVTPAPLRPAANTLVLGPQNPICEGSPTPSNPMTNNADTQCQAVNGGMNFVAVWYDNMGVMLPPSGAAPTMNPTTTTTWQVRCKNTTTGCISLTARNVTFTVNPAPPAPAVFGADPIAQFYPKEACQGPTGSTVTLDPVDILTVPNTIPFNIGCPIVPAHTLRWYLADGTTLLNGTGNSPTTLPTDVAGLQTYKVACVRNSTGCESLTKTTITFMVNPAPAAPTAPITLSPMTACASTPANAPMSNNATCQGVGGPANPVWYADNAGVPGAPLAGAPNTTPAATTTYHVYCKNTTTNCLSLTYTSVTFTVFPTPTINPIVPATATYCEGASVPSLALSGTPATAMAPNSAVKFKYSGGASIGLVDGTGNSLPGFTAMVVGEVVVNVPIIITPYTYGPNGTDDGGTGDDCLGAPFTYTITVVPTPTVTFTCPAPVCANDAFSAITFSGPVAGTVFNWTNDNTSIGLGASGMGNIASFNGLNASTTMSNVGVLSVTPSVTVNSVTCTGPAVTCNLVVKPRPSSNLTASQTDVCPNTEVTLNPNCSIPTPTSTVQWGNGPGSALPAPAGPTVTPNAPDLTYIYTAICIADGCAGTMSSATVRTHRLLVDIVKVAHPGGNVNQPGPIMEVQNDLGKDLTVAKNTITNNDGTRTWNIIARPCYAPVGSISFEFLAGPLPLSYKTVDNFAPHAFFANDNATSFYSQASTSYGPGSMPPYSTGGTAVFPNGTYTILVEGRTNAVAGSIPAARNKLSGGALLSSRSITFKVQGSTPGAREGVSEVVEEVVDTENWISLVQNPISEEIMLRLSGKVGDDIQLNLVNLQGQEVHQSNVKLASRSELNTINVRNFNTGFYILKAVNGEKVKTIKVLKVQE